MRQLYPKRRRGFNLTERAAAPVGTPTRRGGYWSGRAPGEVCSPFAWGNLQDVKPFRRARGVNSVAVPAVVRRAAV